VDTEIMLGVGAGEGYRIVSDPEAAEVIVVNTCGFIGPAKEESIDTILEMGAFKEAGTCQKLVVTGCLSQRYPEELAKEMPEVDHFLGSSDMLKLANVLRGSAERLLVGNPADWVMQATDPRTRSTRGASAYVKLGEGCNRNCSFCVIPKLRGKQRSRSIDDIEREVRELGRNGVLELNLVSQDTIAYGRDLTDGTDLARLLERIAQVEGPEWIRLFYLYPERLTDTIIDVIAKSPRILPYVDMPLQHASDAMLRRMRRGHGGDRLRQVVERVRAQIEGVVFRTAFIVGHPGETDADFRELVEFVQWARFDRVGVFHYSDEDECDSFGMDDKVPREVAEERAAELMSVQKTISAERNEALVGQDIDVLVEGPSDESDLVMVGRHRGQAPDIDGVVYLSGGYVRPGQIRRARVTSATEYDLLGEVDDLEPEVAFQTGVVREVAPPIAHRESDGRRVRLRTVR
jgi:ribosomal protein S12 methylthiotransferase